MSSKRTIPKQSYDRDYFLRRVQGGDIFTQSKGTALAWKHQRMLELAGDLRNKLLLDIGCGRGDFAIGATRKGAVASACDFSPDAISLAKEFSNDFLGNRNKISFTLLDNHNFNTGYTTGYFDVVACADVIEHLDDCQIDLLLDEAYRVLKTEGHLIIHTGPNLLYLRYGRYVDFWLTYCAAFLIRNLKPAMVRKEAEDLHINEQTIHSLERRLHTHRFYGKVWAEQGHTDRWRDSKPTIKALRSLWRRTHDWAAPVLCSEIYAVCGKHKR